MFININSIEFMLLVIFSPFIVYFLIKVLDSIWADWIKRDHEALKRKHEEWLKDRAYEEWMKHREHERVED